VRHLNPNVVQEALHPESIFAEMDQVPQYAGISIDTRTIRPQEIFFAIVGATQDGHQYVAEAFAKGAAAAVVNRTQMQRFAGPQAGTIYVVDDTRQALLDLAVALRRRIEATFGAVTGSNGKTTTKEMFHAIVAVNHAAFRSPGNLNNLLGVPISLGMMSDEAQFAVFELGISEPGEMTRLAAVLRPELAVITNIGATHLETMGTVDNVLKAKFELVDGLAPGATIVLNADDPLLMAEAGRRRLSFVGFGIKNKCPFRAERVRRDGAGIRFRVGGAEIALPVFGRVNIYNALAAIAAASAWGCTSKEWKTGLSRFRPLAMRLEVEEYQGRHLLIDCYNANPDSVAATLASLADFDVPGKKIAVLGDMLELGQASPELHFRTGGKAAQSGVDVLLCLGPESRRTAEGAVAAGMKSTSVFHFLDHQILLEQLVTVAAKGDLILCKGSRGMELEKIVNGLKSRLASE
jgi:UDP-N-acetylmuramoyl-tripeptide--D-alanyl-D-alanine ligase